MGAGTSSRLISLPERPILHIASLDWVTEAQVCCSVTAELGSQAVIGTLICPVVTQE